MIDNTLILHLTQVAKAACASAFSLAITMKKITVLIILVSVSFLMYSQTLNKDIDFVTISYSGDSTLFTERYEIHKRKIYYITPVMNYLDIKGVKYKTRVRIKRQNRLEIYGLIEKINLLSESQYQKEKDKEITYYLQIVNSEKKKKTYYFYTEEIPYELKRIFIIIRNNWTKYYRNRW